MKQSLRSHGISARRSISSEDRAMFERQVLKKLMRAVDWSSIATLHVYSSLTDLSELSTVMIIQYVREYHPLIQLTIGVASKTAQIPIGQYDVIFVPVVAFDSVCHRIGYGGGWYDRFLANQPQALKIGLAYEMQKVQLIPAEAHDVPLDMVVTEKAVYMRANKNTLL